MDATPSADAVPTVHVNAAMSADGKLSTRRREQVRISGSDDFGRVDRLRAEHDAIMVGVGTVLADDPSLVRHDRDRRAAVGKTGPPARVVADSRARTPPGAAILQDDPRTYVLVSAAAPADRRTALREAGARVIEAGADRVALPAALAALHEAGVGSLLVEGGGELIAGLFGADLVDRLTVFVGALILGGREAPTLTDGDGFIDAAPALELVGVSRLDDGVVLDWRVDGRHTLDIAD